MAEAKNSVQKEVLPNGLVVITEPMEHVHSRFGGNLAARTVRGASPQS